MKFLLSFLIKTLNFLLLLLFLTPVIALPQVSEEWAVPFESEESFDNVNDVTADNSGNVYLTGYSGFSGDLLTVKYNSSGEEQWANIYAGTGDQSDIGVAVAVDNSGNVYSAGNTRKDIGSEFQDIILIKYNAEGDTSWTRTFNGTADDFDLAADVALDNEGNIYVTGISTDSTVDEDITTMKYDTEGNLLWIKYYNGTADNVDEGKAIFIDGSNNIYVTGYSRSGPFSSDGDLTTIKYNSAGEEQWARIYDLDDEFDGGISVAADASGNVYVAGTSYHDSFNEDIITIKYNSSGEEQWAKQYNGPGNSTDRGVKVGFDNAGNVYTVGSSQSSNSLGSMDLVTIKYNSAGDEQYAIRYDGKGDRDFGIDLEVDQNANLYVLASSQDSTGGVTLDYVTIKYNSSGQEQWKIIYNGPNGTGDSPVGLSLDGSNNVYVTGTSQSHITTVKYSQVTGLKTISTGNPQKFSLSKNYPNPFNPSTKIRFSIPQTSYVRFSVYDILGNEVGIFINEEKPAGEYEFEFTDGTLASGTYFYQLEAGNFVETGKMSLIK